MQNDLNIAKAENTIQVPEPYEVHEKIGAGGGGTVYKAYDKNLRKDVVIKKIHDTITDEEQQRVEVDTLKNLHHQYLPQVFSYFQIDGVGYTVMDYVEGESFREMLDRGVKFKQKKVIKYAQQLIEAVKYLHTQKVPIYHGDIKPDNIMLTPEDNICLIDFNVSGITNEGRAMTYGFTPGYGAPEQYADFHRIQQAMLEAEKKRAQKANDQNKENTVLQNNRTEVLAQSGEKTELLLGNGKDETELLIQKDKGETEILRTDEKGDTDLLQDDDDKTEMIQPVSNEVRNTDLLWDPAEKADQTEERYQQQNSGTKIELSEGIVIDKRTDIYSIGATLYHLVSGVAPKMANNTNIAELVPNISDGLAYLITKAMMNKPESRYKDCDSMLKTIHQIDRMDRRYKRLNRMEYLIVFILCIILAGSVGMVQQGKLLMQHEKDNSYQDLVNQMADERTAGNYESLSALLEQAIALYPENSSAYYEMALANYEQEQYEKCINYLYDNVYSNGIMDYGQMEDSFYFLSASSYFELEDYQMAVDYYEKAVLIHPNMDYYYRDYVIALARLNRISEARQVLEKAREYGVTTDTLYLLEGEIYYIEKKYDQAGNSLKECIKSTDNSETLLRAYSKLDEVYEKTLADEELYDARIPLLEEATKKVSQENGIALMERLAQAYMDRADLMGSEEDNESAIRVLESIRNQGYGTFQTDYNIAVLYEKIKEYDKAIEWIRQMIETRGEDYRWYKRLAYVELERQGTLDNQDRNYSKFKEYYDTMEVLYATSGNPTEDMETQVLKQLYSDLVEQNWLE